MTQKYQIKNDIEKHILQALKQLGEARFIDLRPEGVETNLYSYHLSKLVRLGFVDKVDGGYRHPSVRTASDSDQAGHNNSAPGGVPTKIVFVAQDGYGKTILAGEKSGTTLPYGNMESRDDSVLAAAKRVAKQIFSIDMPGLKHAGVCYVRSRSSVQLVHVVTCDGESLKGCVGYKWVSARGLYDANLAPGDIDILSRTFFRDPFFFEEFNV